jgi:hypothetical protein
VATRIQISPSEDGIAHRLDSWQLLIDRAFVAQWNALAADCAEPNAFCESWFYSLPCANSIRTAAFQSSPYGMALSYAVSCHCR